MAGINLKVDSNTLVAQSGIIKNKISQLERKWNSINDAVNRSRRYWEGETSELRRDYYYDLKDDVGLVFKRLKEHPDNLLRMANIYDYAEAKAAEEASSLPVDVIK